MLYRFFKKYLSTIFLFSILLGSMHHHNDLKLHSDCKVCVVHSHLLTADVPSETLYLTQLDLFNDSFLLPYSIYNQRKIHTTLHSRAPPSLS